MELSEVDRAIAIVADSRDTHLKWIAYLEHPQTEQVVDDVGDVNHHFKCVQDYDKVLNVLVKLKNFLST